MANLISQITLPNNTTYIVKDGTIAAGTGISITTDDSTGVRTIANTGITSISVSNSWTDGTTAGPKLSTTVSGVTGTAVAIPAATSEKSGVVTTTTQTFAGSKTFNGTAFNIQADSIVLTNSASHPTNKIENKSYVEGLSFYDNYTGIYRWNLGTSSYGGGLFISSRQPILSQKLITPYNSTQTYEEGDLASYNNTMYRCTTEITEPEEWTSSHWGLLNNSTFYGLMTAMKIFPIKNETYSLGQSGFRWSNIYTAKVHFGTTSTYGSETRPIYWNSDVPSACSTYAGGTAVTLNGTDKSASTVSFYAPTTAGTSGYLLASSGSGAPTWTAAPDISAMVKYSGTLTSGEVVVTSGTDGTVVSSGYTIATSVPSGALFTDENVTQSALNASSTSWRKILLSATSSTSVLFTPTTQTGHICTTTPIEAQPSTGTLRANIFDLKNKAQIQYNSTDDSIDFVFT